MRSTFELPSRHHEARDVMDSESQPSRSLRLNDAQFTLVLVTGIVLIYVLGRFIGWWW